TFRLQSSGRRRRSARSCARDPFRAVSLSVAWNASRRGRRASEALRRSHGSGRRARVRLPVQEAREGRATRDSTRKYEAGWWGAVLTPGPSPAGDTSVRGPNRAIGWRGEPPDPRRSGLPSPADRSYSLSVTWDRRLEMRPPPLRPAARDPARRRRPL